MVQQVRSLCIKPKGLINRGSNCFFNSVMQCLFSITDFSRFFKEANFSGGQRFSRSLQTFIKNYIEEKHVDPEDFLNVLRSHIGILDGNEQDAHEFLVLFLDLLEVELGTSKKIECDQDIQKNQNIIIKVFGGIESTEIMCMKCKSKNVTTHPFTGISVTAQDTIQDALQRYEKTEALTGENGIKCEKCSNTSSTKLIRLDYPPEILVIHVLRFKSSNAKDNTKVKINDTIKISNKNYRLLAMVCHEGTLRSGHYVSYAKRSFKWALYDDSSVREVDYIPTNSSSPYLVFYTRI